MLSSRYIIPVYLLTLGLSGCFAMDRSGVCIGECSPECEGKDELETCGEPPTEDCKRPSICMNGVCVATLAEAGTACGDRERSDCDLPDICDSEGTCLDNYVMSGTACGDRNTTDCTLPDSCGQNGQCLPNHVLSGQPCGDDTTTDCNAPDTCDGNGVCLDNHTPAGEACGDDDTECSGADTCDENGACQPNHHPDDMPCGSDDTTECTAPDFCDGQGACSDNHAPDNAACNDCPTPDFCDSCTNGVCPGLTCSQLSCWNKDECAPANTAGICADASPNDCMAPQCMDPMLQVVAGAAVNVNFDNWQAKATSFPNHNNLSLCNVTLPVTHDGVITSWQIFVTDEASNGDKTRLTVIRCQTGHGGNSVLSDCITVGRGPKQKVESNKSHTLTLAASIQLDSASPSSSGIVVQRGDILCADTEDIRIGFDCDGSSATPDCNSAPRYELQYKYGLRNASQPFDLGDTVTDNGVLMIKAYGPAPTSFMRGMCTAASAEPDGTLCTHSTGGLGVCSTGACIDLDLLPEPIL